MGTGEDIENQKHTALSCSHCQGTHRESNCLVLPCSHHKEEGHVSLLCPERLAKVRKSKDIEMWIRRQNEAEGSAPVATSGTTSQQSEGTKEENPRKRKSRASPATPTSSDHESVSNDDCDPYHLGPIKIARTNRKITRLRWRKPKNKKKSLQAPYSAVIQGTTSKASMPTSPVRPLQIRRAHSSINPGMHSRP